MHEVVIPKLNNNDESYTLVEWLVEDGQLVAADDAVAEVETSKALEELTAGRAGVVQRIAAAGTDCRPGDAIALVYSSEDDRQRAMAAATVTAAVTGTVALADGAGPVITDAARERAAELGIPEQRLRTLAHKVVKREHVDQLDRDPVRPQGSAHRLSRSQQAIGVVVTESHRTIPAAHAVIRVQIDEALVVARRLSKQNATLIGLPELLVKLLAGLRDRFGLFFARRVGDDAVELADTARIGVTVDVGTGLFVPVVPDADRLAVGEIAEVLERMRGQARDNGFREADLAGMNLMLSLHTDPDLVLALPMIHPGTTCVVGLAGVQEVLALDEADRVVVARFVNVSVAYDHRVINGRDAVLFLQAIKNGLEYPAALGVTATRTTAP